MPTDKSDPLANQNIQDRFYGTNDPLAEKILSTASKKIRKLQPPVDETITSLWIGGIDNTDITEVDIHSIFYIYGEIKSIRLIREKQIAFVEYESRKQAEKAAEALYEKLEIKDRKLRLNWAEKQQYGSDKLGMQQKEAGLLGAAVNGYSDIKVNPVTSITSTSSTVSESTPGKAKIPLAPDLFKTTVNTKKKIREKVDGEEGEIEEVSDEEEDEEEEKHNQQKDGKDILIPPLVST